MPIELRAAFDTLDADTVDKFRRELYSRIREPWVRKVNGRDRVLEHRSNEHDFGVALHAMKVDESARRVAQDRQQRDSDARWRGDHTCPICGRIDRTANSSRIVANVWCEGCRSVDAAQQVAEHAALIVNGKSVGERISDYRKQATP